jgi:SAM-dependent methyltransferase
MCGVADCALAVWLLLPWPVSDAIHPSGLFVRHPFRVATPGSGQVAQFEAPQTAELPGSTDCGDDSSFVSPRALGVSEPAVEKTPSGLGRSPADQHGSLGPLTGPVRRVPRALARVHATSRSPQIVSGESSTGPAVGRLTRRHADPELTMALPAMPETVRRARRPRRWRRQSHGRRTGGDATRHDEVVLKNFSRPGAYARLYGECSSDGFFFNTRMDRVAELLKDCAGGTLLDVGCGPGMMLSYLLDRGFRHTRLFAVDRSGPMIDECKRRLGHRGSVHPLVGRIEQLPFHDGAFDVVLAMGVIEYAEAAVAIRELARVVTPGGTVITTMLNKLSPYRWWDQTIYRRVRDLRARLLGRDEDAKPQLRFYSERTYRRLLIANQLKPVEVVYFDFNVVPTPFDDRYPRRAIFLNKKLQFLAHTRFRWLGTGFIVKARPLPPVQERAAELRRYPRIAVSWPVTVDTGQRRLHLETIDVSRLGAKVRSRAPLEVGTPAQLHLQRPHGRPLDVQARVSRADANGLVFAFVGDLGESALRSSDPPSGGAIIE